MDFNQVISVQNIHPSINQYLSLSFVNSFIHSELEELTLIGKCITCFGDARENHRFDSWNQANITRWKRSCLVIIIVVVCPAECGVALQGLFCLLQHSIFPEEEGEIGIINSHGSMSNLQILIN